MESEVKTHACVRYDNDLLNEREATHGDFSKNTIVMQTIKDALRGGSQWENLTAYQKEALDMIAHKMGRIVEGDPSEPDHWKDISGYSELVSVRL